MKIFDTHCHLQWHEDEDPIANRLQRAVEAGAEACICVGVDYSSSQRALRIAEQYDGVYASVGLHPNDLPKDPPELEKLFRKIHSLSQQPPYVAIGETGLDFFRNRTTHHLQAKSFRHHLEMAHETKLPVIIHCREAYQEAASLLQDFSNETGEPIAGVMHCWSTGSEILPDFLDLGLYISFAGNVSYPKSNSLRDAASNVPLDRLLVETDAPFLAPQPKRGKRNEPAYIRHTLDCIAELKGQDAENLAQVTWANACTLFGLD